MAVPRGALIPLWVTEDGRQDSGALCLIVYIYKEQTDFHLFPTSRYLINLFFSLAGHPQRESKKHFHSDHPNWRDTSSYPIDSLLSVSLACIWEWLSKELLCIIQYFLKVTMKTLLCSTVFIFPISPTNLPNQTETQRAEGHCWVKYSPCLAVLMVRETITIQISVPGFFHWLNIIDRSYGLQIPLKNRER